MRRNLYLIVFIMCIMQLTSCQNTLHISEGNSSQLSVVEVPTGEVGPRFQILEHGAFTADSQSVITGNFSLIGVNTDSNSQYNQYLMVGPGQYRFAPGGAYTVTFSYLIVDSDGEGFETVMFSPTGAANNLWVDSLLIHGPEGSSGEATFTFNLREFSDYELLWNVISTGSIVIDDIEIRDGNGVLVASEGFEKSTLKVAQAFLPAARVGQRYRCTPAVIGTGVRPIRLIRSEGRFPLGLAIDVDGVIEGIPEEAGAYTICLVYADADGVESTLLYQMEIVSPEHISSYAVSGESNIHADRVSYIYEPYSEAFRNPLKGLRPYVDSAISHPWASLGRKYIEWNLIERNASDTVEHVKRVTDDLIGNLPSYNIKVVPRVYLHWPPDMNYWPEDLIDGDYYSKQFQERLFSLIAKLGEAWDDDPRIAYIEMGLIGQWGEQHDPGFGNFGFEQPLRAVDYEQQFGQAFEQAFSNKLVMNRYPRDFEEFGFGLYWDVFGAFGEGFWGNDAIPLAAELKKPHHLEKWKTSVRGGEIDPTFLDYSDWNEQVMYDLMKTYDEYLIGYIRELHWNHLGISEHIDEQDVELWKKASAIQNALGYTFCITQATLPAQLLKQELPLSITVENTGSSPMYYNWPLEVFLLDPKTHTPVWRGSWPELDIRSWLPSESYRIEHVFTVPVLPRGEYIIALSIIDPSGKVPAVRFANKNYYNGGYTPLGMTAMGTRVQSFTLSGFDDIAEDRSLYYLPPERE